MIKYFKTPNIFKWIFHRRVWGFSVSNSVYLTFDDGPTEELTDWILRFLAKEEVKATFFCVGSNAQRHPELMDKILADGHQLGNHTMNHDRGTKTSKKVYIESIKKAGEIIPSKLFRPPYGRLPILYGKDIRENYKIIMWSWLSYDYDNTVPVDLIMKKANKIKGGDILVLHDNVKTKERLEQILPEVISIVKSKGLKFETISF